MSPKSIFSNILAGGVLSVISITSGISVAALVFAGTTPEFFAVGVMILLIGTFVCALGGTLAGGDPGAIIMPRSATAPVFAGMVVAVIAATTTSGQPDATLPTIVMAMMVTTAFCGIALFLLGTLTLGRLVRYIPYPVMGGFFAGIGLIFVKGGISVATGQSVALDSIGAFSVHSVLLALPAVIFALSLAVAQRCWGYWWIFPVFLAAGFGVFYATFGFTDQTVAAVRAAGWLPGVAATATTLPVFDLADLARVDWSLIAAQAGGIATVALLCAIILLLDLSGIEIVTNQELSPDRELKVAGVTNLLSGLAGGYPGVHVAADTGFTRKLGGGHRIMGFVYAAAVALAIAAGTDFISSIPKFILGGLLIYMGIDFLVDWAWRVRRDLPISDYLVILAILGVIAATGILQGVAFGIAVTVVLFVITYSRLSVIKSEMTGSEHASHVDRDPESRRILDREGRRIRIKRLQGFIFFGSADRLLDNIKKSLANAADSESFDYLVIDFRHVSQLDSSAIYSFKKLVRLSETANMHIVLAGLAGAVRKRLEQMDFFTNEGAKINRLCFAELDEGIAWCEEHLLAEIGHEYKSPVASLAARLAQILESEEAAAEAAEYFTPVQVAKGDYLFDEGSVGDCLYLVHSGAVAVVVQLPDGRQHIVRIFREGAILGEMAIYTGAPRSASVRVEESGTLFRLDADRLQDMQLRHPEAAGLFHRFVVRLLAERLARTNSELQQYS